MELILPPLFALLQLIVAHSTDAPDWGPVYTASGVLSIPYAEIEEPFIGYYDETLGRSRIDYYNGMVQTYQLPDGDEFGLAVYRGPYSTNTTKNAIICLTKAGRENKEVLLQGIVPNVQNYTFEETVQFRGYNCNKFSFEEKWGLKKNSYIVWVRYQPDTGAPIPFRFEMRGIYLLKDTHYDHYFLDYDFYSTDDIQPKILDPKLRECKDRNAPRGMNYATFNPMHEFIHPESADHITIAFNDFKNTHSKRYDDEAEHSEREVIFKNNLRFILSQNRANLGYNTEINHLADRKNSELDALNGFMPSNSSQRGTEFPYKRKEYERNFPDQHDWRIYGAVTPVKDQATCGSCYAFGATGAVEGAFFLKNNHSLVKLSEQALIDCSWGYGNSGCMGGRDSPSYEWLMVEGLPTFEDYGGNLGQTGWCHIDNVTRVAPITGYVRVPENNWSAFKFALYKHGPLQIAISTAPKAFKFYSNGIFNYGGCENQPLNHAVLAVGYGKIDGEDYVLVKNSWSTYWGNDGYILISPRDKNCGVLSKATYVTM